MGQQESEQPLASKVALMTDELTREQIERCIKWWEREEAATRHKEHALMCCWTILALRSLSAPVCPHIVTSDEGTSYCKLAAAPAPGMVMVPIPEGMLKPLSVIGKRLHEEFRGRFSIERPRQFSENERQVIVAAMGVLLSALPEDKP